MFKIPKNKVERNKGAAVAQVDIAVNRGAANIHSYAAFIDWFEDFLIF
jgi:hypothetical protein